MSSAIERRLSRVEAQVAKRLERVKICNCKVVTRHHNANCLRAILNASSRECPVHGFRDFGFIWQVPNWVILSGDDDQFCSCPEHPWRSFVLNSPRTWEAHHAAKEAWAALPHEPSNFEEQREQLHLVLAEYNESRQQWAEIRSRTHRREEILELNLDDVTRKNGE